MRKEFAIVSLYDVEASSQWSATPRYITSYLHRRDDLLGLVKGMTIGVDATTLEANAALRTIVRRDSGERYEEFLTRLAKESGIATPTRNQ